MKKNISINISGIIFHIDEDAYSKLGKYQFALNESRSECMQEFGIKVGAELVLHTFCAESAF